jgi:fructose-1,6-bisphosphatase/inositol monophosphatase family enzyme
VGGALDAMMVCSGSAELWIEPTSKPWDLAPLQIIAQESGACYFDYTGADTIYGGNAVICAPGLERVARDFLGLA